MKIYVALVLSSMWYTFEIVIFFSTAFTPGENGVLLAYHVLEYHIPAAPKRGDNPKKLYY